MHNKTLHLIQKVSFVLCILLLSIFAQNKGHFLSTELSVRWLDTVGWWSSVHAHLSGKDNHGIRQPEKLLTLTGDWRTYLEETQGFQDQEFEQHERTGRPLGTERFIEKAEHLLNRELKKKKPEPKGHGKDTH